MYVLIPALAPQELGAGGLGVVMAGRSNVDVDPLHSVRGSGARCEVVREVVMAVVHSLSMSRRRLRRLLKE